MNERMILEMKEVHTYYKNPVQNPFAKKSKKYRHVLRGVSFSVKEGEILGVVGESGCGKSTLAKTILGFVKHVDGTIIKNEEQIQMVFQDPYGSLNPSKKIGWILEEPLRMQQGLNKQQRQEKVLEMIQKVGLEELHLERYPRELSGGQRQRVSIAIALIQGAKFIIADEPVSALDVTIQKQIMELMLELQRQFGLTYLFISHDLNVIYQMCDRVMVMKKGKVIEIGTIEEVFHNPKEGYTKELLESTV